MQFIELKIKGMTCDHCAAGIEKKFNGNSAILDKAVSYPEGTGKFSFDESQISANEIIKTINDTGHYRVVEEIAPATAEPVKNYDLIIIGGGSAAFAAAIKAESLGITTLMVNAGLNFGGTCVNVGCVPSKFLIRAGETAYHARHSNFESIKPEGVSIDFAQLMADKKQLVANMQQKKYMDIVRDFKHLTLMDGWATFIDDKTVAINGEGKYKAIKFLIATGATTNIPNIEGIEQVDYLTNITLFDLEEKPESLTILGAGYIGLEIATAYSRLGVKVRLMEFTDRLLRTQMPDVSGELEQQLRKEGVEILPNYRVAKFEKNAEGILMHIRKPDGSLIELLEKGRLLIATGTTPNTPKLGLENTSLTVTSTGHLAVTSKMETNLPHIYAAGDVANTPAYVYTAAREGSTAVENAFAGNIKEIDYTALPWVVFTDPQVAGAGMDEAEAKAKNIPFEVSKIELKDVPRAIAANDMRGFIKLIRNPETDKLIGARIVAPEGGELIQQLSMAIKYGVTVNELAESFYPYLTLSEGIKLAAITFGKDVATLSCCAN